MSAFDDQTSQRAAQSAMSEQALWQPEQSWRKRVIAAKAATDPHRQRLLLIELAQEALSTGYQVNIVATMPTGGPVTPAQYEVAPAVNFDFHLEGKTYWPKAGRTGRLGERSGYFFATAGKAYAIIGPGAIEEYSPLLTRMAADHELFHTAHHVGKQVRATQELEAWVDAFVHYFHKIYPVRKMWMPLITYYAGADNAAQEQALSILTSYFEQQSPVVQTALRAWLARRQKDMGRAQLVLDLTSALHQVPSHER